MNSGTRKKGFTLIELLVVIAVLSVLMATLVPALQKAREQARNVLCATNMSAWGKSIQLYAAENRDFFPNMGQDPIRDSFDFVWVSGTMQQKFFQRYLFELGARATEDDNSVLFCPADMFHRTVYQGDVEYYVSQGLIGYNVLFGNDVETLYAPGGYNNYKLPECPNGENWLTRRKVGGAYNDGPILSDMVQSIGPTGWANSEGIPFSPHASGNNNIPKGGHFLFEDGHVQWYQGVDDGLDNFGQIGLGGYQHGWQIYFALPDVR